MKILYNGSLFEFYNGGVYTGFMGFVKLDTLSVNRMIDFLFSTGGVKL